MAHHVCSQSHELCFMNFARSADSTHIDDLGGIVRVMMVEAIEVLKTVLANIKLPPHLNAVASSPTNYE